LSANPSVVISIKPRTKTLDLPSRGGVILQGIVKLGALILFPGYVIYHYSLIVGWIPAFAGGLFGVSALALSSVGVVYLLANWLPTRYAAPQLERFFSAFILYLLVCTAIGAVSMAGRPYMSEAIAQSLATLVIWLAVYLVGACLRLHVGRTGLILAGFALGVIVCFAHAVAVNASFVGPFIAFSAGGLEDNDVSTYQGIGRSLVVTALLIAAVLPRLTSQLAVFVLAVIMLLSLGSRAHLFVMMLVLLFQVAFFGFRGRNWPIGVLAVIVVVGVGYAMASIFFETRASEIFDLAQSTSWQARQAATWDAIRVIEASPLFGDLGYHFRDASTYAHNALSVWAAYGVVAFVWFFALMIYSLSISAYRAVLCRRSSPLWVLALQFNFVALVLALASESIFTSVFPAMAWGVTAQALRSEQRYTIEAVADYVKPIE